MTLVEQIPIGTVVGVVADQVLATARAARDVFSEKGNLSVLSRYLFDMVPILRQLQLRELNDTQAVRQALEFLMKDVDRANNLVGKYRNRASFYCLLKCRTIVREIQDVTRDIGKSLSALSLASAEGLSDISQSLDKLHQEMQRAEFQATRAHIDIVENLDKDLCERRRDHKFANIMLEEIARAVGVAVEPSEVRQEITNLIREKEQAAARGERADQMFLEQVIRLLSCADAAVSEEQIKAHYQQMVRTIENYATDDAYMAPLRPFICPITKLVMTDPVSLCTGTTCERVAIEAWFKSGRATDPDTGLVLEDLTLRDNIGLKQSIQEWRELNYCLQIRSAKRKLLSGVESACLDAFAQLQELIHENLVNKDWIALEGLLDIIVMMVGNPGNKILKRYAFKTLAALLEGHTRNKDRLVEAGGLNHVIACLGRDEVLAKAAINFLFQLLFEGSKWNERLCAKVKQQQSAILFLVILRNSPALELAEKAHVILTKLCDDDDDTISFAASCNWYSPLINRLCNGSRLSKLSMVSALVAMDLIDHNVKLLGEEGAIPPLVNMATGDLESKDLAFSVLVKLLNFAGNKKLFAEAGGVPLVLEMIFSPRVPTAITSKCCKILEMLCADNIADFLVDANGELLDLKTVIANLCCTLESPLISPVTRKPLLYAVLCICMSKQFADKQVAATCCVPIVLPFLEDSNCNIRELALKLVSYLSEYEPGGISAFLLDNRLEAFVRFLDDDATEDERIAAAGLVSNLPKSQVTLTERLLALNAVPKMLSILRVGNSKAKENVLGALFRFTDPTRIEMQETVVNLGAYPLFVSILRSGSTTAKARAAALIANLSSNSSALSTNTNRTTGCWCLQMMMHPPWAVCKVHGGECTVTSSFCVLKANALPEIVRLLCDCEPSTGHEALRVLATLVQDDVWYRGGVKVLYEAGAVDPILDALSWGTVEIKEEALAILERLFEDREIGDCYYLAARIPLISLSTQSHEHNGHLGRKATRLLVELERCSRSGSMPLNLGS